MPRSNKVDMDAAVKHAQEDSRTFLIDVRSAKAYESGHIPGAHLYTPELFSELGIQLDDTIYLYCTMGINSAQARDYLMSEGYQNVVNIGGIRSYRHPLVTGME